MMSTAVPHTILIWSIAAAHTGGRHLRDRLSEKTLFEPDVGLVMCAMLRLSQVTKKRVRMKKFAAAATMQIKHTTEDLIQHLKAMATNTAAPLRLKGADLVLSIMPVKKS